MKLSRLYLVVFGAMFVMGCGGGGGGDNEPASTATATAAVTATGKPALTSIRLDGNSVMHGAQTNPAIGSVWRSVNAPGPIIQAAFPSVIVSDYSVNGISVQGIRGSSFWPPAQCPSHHVILEYHNNLVSNFKEQLTAMLDESCAAVKILVIANVPTLSVNPNWSGIYTNANMVREVAIEKGVKLCDPYFGTSYNHPDGIHLNDLGYKLLADKIAACIRETL